MSQTKTITINGRHYDAHSGLAVDTPTETASQATSQPPAHSGYPLQRHSVAHAVAVHPRIQRSHTLNRKSLKKPAILTASPVQQPTHTIIPRKIRTPHTVAPHAAQQHESPKPQTVISRFAPHPTATHSDKRVMDIGPVAHPHVAKAHAISKAKAESPLAQSRPAPRRTAQEIKQSAVHKAVVNTSVNHGEKPKPRLLKRHPRTISIISASIALVILGGYLTYLNMPSLSVRVAAAQSGINASYPNYQPDGYSLNGLVGYSDGKVTMKFASNGGPAAFTINQTKSNWDSVAVLDNYVAPRAGASYIPYTERGLTIYTYGNNAAWVNGGILYTIEGDAPLSSEQIRRIATSLI